MSRELYGIPYEDREELNRVRRKLRTPVSLSPAWRDPWKRGTRAEWQSLGRKYGFRLAWSAADLPLDLPVALTGQHWTLCTIPEVAEAETSGTDKASLTPKQR